MRRFEPADAGYEDRVRESFARQSVMRLIGARLARVEPGLCEIELPWRADLCQQHGYAHAGITTTIADSAGGYAAFSLFPADTSVLTVEYKINLLSPAEGERLLATGRVTKPGRTITICELEVVAFKGGEAKTCAIGLQTMMCLHGRSDRPSS
jgi:uncharacterized protein (TIGR00369 family)